MLQASELRSGSARLNELNLFFHTLSKSGLKVLSFSEVCALNPLTPGRSVSIISISICTYSSTCNDGVYSCNLFMFLQTKVTTLVEGYGGWALRMEVVPIESAYPGFGKLVVS
jgi:hypothetical protein